MSDEPSGGTIAESELADMILLLRRVIAARIRSRDAVDDLVQETLARVLASRHRLDPEALIPYAVVVARNLVSTRWRDEDRRRRHSHLLVEVPDERRPEDDLLVREDASTVADALSRLSPRERAGLVAHEVDGRDTTALASDWESTPGAVAAQLHRARAKLRVEYLLAAADDEAPTARCRPVLLAISGGQRRRQRELDVGEHLLGCDYCVAVSEALLQTADEESADRVTIRVRTDADVVVARQRGRELAAGVGFTQTELTLIATAISEMTRNIVMFAVRGEVIVTVVDNGTRSGVTVIARDIGPGIADLDRALQDGYSTYGGMGLGLSGSRRLMDEFDITSEPGRGTTVVMTKWRSGGDGSILRDENTSPKGST